MALPRFATAPRRAALAASGWVALAATALPGGSPLRWIPVLAFVGLAPGLALLTPRPTGPRPGTRLEVLALAAPLSLSLATLTATGLFLADAFSTGVFLGILAAFVTVVALLPGVPLPAALPGAGEPEPAGSAGPAFRFRTRGRGEKR
ncbi:hypothetical protein [Streptomyces sp. CC208A]|uniref:hypothetical protein n=1 Tax=Streptomyces sp. CC208A TaxID=3044573 RepID=UPI0024A9560D|nr:hypothetical protein [Streptomyces sp. CC208A]